jgi:GNAT superfamily N-acetyltransferase
VGVVLRPAVADDAEAGADLHLACWRESYGPLVGPDLLEQRLQERERWVRAWHGQLAQGPPRTMAVAGDELVGFAVTGPSRDGTKQSGSAAPYELYAVYTRRVWWGTGLGQALLDAVLPDGPTSLWVLEANQRAQAFYRRNGFAPDGAREHYAGLDAWELRMVRP